MNNSQTTIARALLACLGPVLFAGCADVGGRLASDGARVRDQASAVTLGTRQAPLTIAPSTLGSPTDADARAAAALNAPVARRATRAWIGARMTAVQSDEVLPPIFTEPKQFNFDDKGGRVTIQIIAERLSRMTNVPVRVQPDVYAPLAGRGGNAGAGFQGNAQTLAPLAIAPLPGAALPAGAPLSGGNAPLPLINTGTAAQGMPLPGSNALGDPFERDYRQPITDVDSVDMRWNGSLSSFLDHVTGRLNLSWSYRDGVVVIERYITESFEMSAFIGTQDFKMTLGSTSSGQTGENGNTGGTNAAMDVNESGKIAVLESLRKSIETMVKDTGGSVLLSEGSGRFTVTATRDVMSRVREVIKHEDAAMNRRAHIQLDIYSVTTNNADERGVDWNLVINNVARTWGATIRSPASLGGNLGGSMSYSVLAPAEGVDPSGSQARFANSTAMLKLLHDISDTAQYRPVSMMAMNRQWSRKTSLKTDGYLSETTPATASSVGSGAPGLKTSSIVTGDKFMVQPAILDNGTILLKLGISLTELISLFEVTAGSGATFQRVQTPVTSGTDDQMTIRLQPGEVSVLTGLSRRLASNGTRTLGDGIPVGLGGSRTAGYKREDFLIVVRATPLQ
jgi:type IVB pilus formation R64 PilN family outer membrane protein